MSATFTIAADKIDAAETCLRPMCGVGIIRTGFALAVEVFAPFDATRMDRVRDVVLGVDPEASEV